MNYVKLSVVDFTAADGTSVDKSRNLHSVRTFSLSAFEKELKEYSKNTKMNNFR